MSKIDALYEAAQKELHTLTVPYTSRDDEGRVAELQTVMALIEVYRAASDIRSTLATAESILAFEAGFTVDWIRELGDKRAVLHAAIEKVEALGWR